jgi:hypothetical protein
MAMTQYLFPVRVAPVDMAGKVLCPLLAPTVGMAAGAPGRTGRPLAPMTVDAALKGTAVELA